MNNVNPTHLDVNEFLSCYSKKIHRVFFNNSKLDEIFTQKVLKFIHGYQHIDYLSIKNSLRNQDQLQMLFTVLKHKKVIKHLNFKCNLITEDNLEPLLSSLDSYKERIRTLNLSTNYFSINGCRVINNFLSSFISLRDLNISNNDIGIEGARYLQDGLSKLQSLEELNIKSNSLRPEGIELIMKTVAFLPHLSILNVSNNDAGDEGVLIISGFLKNMKMLMVIIVDFIFDGNSQKILCSSCHDHTKIIRSDGKNERIVIKSPVLD